MLDGVHAGEQRIADAGGAVRMRGDLAAQRVRFVDQRLQFLQRVLRRTDLGALGQHAAGGTGLDEIGAELHVLPHLLPHGPGTVGHAVAHRLVLGRQQVVVAAVAAGDADGDAAGEDARTLDLAVRDGIAQRHVGVTGRARYPNRGEAGQQRGTRILRALDRRRRQRDRQAPVALQVGVAMQVHVRIHQAGQHGFSRQVVHRRAGRHRRARGRTDGGDARVLDHDGLVVQHAPGFDIEQAAGLDVGGRRERRRAGDGQDGGKDTQAHGVSGSRMKRRRM